VFKEAKLKVFPEILYTHNDIFYNNQARISIIKPSRKYHLSKKYRNENSRFEKTTKPNISKFSCKMQKSR